MKKTIITLLTGATLTISASAQIIISWSQVGANIVASYTGTAEISEINYDSTYTSSAINMEHTFNPLFPVFTGQSGFSLLYSLV